MENVHFKHFFGEERGVIEKHFQPNAEKLWSKQKMWIFVQFLNFFSILIEFFFPQEQAFPSSSTIHSYPSIQER